MDLFDFDSVVSKLTKQLSENPEVYAKAEKIKTLYKGQRGLMVVDVVSSRRRNYEHRVKPMLKLYEDSTDDLSLQYLSSHEPPNLGLMQGEADTMQQVARALLKFGAESNLLSEDEIVESWAQKASNAEVAERIDSIKGIGPALLQYLRLLSGAETIKPDVWVRSELEKFGVPVNLFSDLGLVEVAKVLAAEVKIPLSVLDQLLWVYPDLDDVYKDKYP